MFKKKLKIQFLFENSNFADIGGQGFFKEKSLFILDVWLSFGPMNTVVVVTCPD